MRMKGCMNYNVIINFLLHVKNFFWWQLGYIPENWNIGSTIIQSNQCIVSHIQKHKCINSSENDRLFYTHHLRVIKANHDSYIAYTNKNVWKSSSSFLIIMYRYTLHNYVLTCIHQTYTQIHTHTLT